MAITQKDLRAEVNRLNKKYKKTNKTAVKLDILQAYGGSQVVIRNKATTGVNSVTYGYKSAREVIENLRYNDSMGDIKSDLNYAHKVAMEDLKEQRRIRAIKRNYALKSRGKK